MPKPPSFNLYDIERRRDRLVDRHLRGFVDRSVTADELATAVRAGLPAGIEYDTVFESVRYLAGQTLTQVELIRLAWRLAGNLARLKAGVATPPWSAQHADEWVPLRILRIVKRRNMKGRIGYEATLRVLAGTPTPMKTTVFWGSGALGLISKDLGFSRYGAYRLSVATDMVGLRLLGKIEASRSRDAPVFHEVQCPDSMIAWNRKNVLRLRFRQGQTCPLNYRHHCHQCVVGYDRCAAGTHAITYEVGTCPECGKTDAAFDPEDRTPGCVQCTAADRLRKPT